MSNSPTLLADIVTKFVEDLPHNITSSEIGGIICAILHEYNMPSYVRGCIFEAVERVMLEHELRDDERTAQAADDVIARAAEKARK
jgi:hypothetical protein